MVLTPESTNIDLQAGAIILIDKPIEWTSFDVVKRMRNVLTKALNVKQRKLKVGHAGTLDPLASGLLIVCAGKATKGISTIQDAYKRYEGVIQLGATTPSYDLETEVNETFATEHITPEEVQLVASSFVGPQMQNPPIFSAIHTDGKRAYDLARKGKDVKLEPRPVYIESLDVELTDNQIKFDVVCTKGTYIRSLAFDIGKALNSGGYLKELRRTKIGDYSVKDAWQIDDFVTFISNANIQRPQ